MIFLKKILKYINNYHHWTLNYRMTLAHQLLSDRKRIVDAIHRTINDVNVSSVLLVWSTCDVCRSSQREDQRSVQLLWLGRQHSFRVVKEACELRLNLWTPQSCDQPQSGALHTAHTNTHRETDRHTRTTYCPTTATTFTTSRKASKC